MSIKINIDPILYDFTDTHEVAEDVVEASGNTVGECLQYLVTQFPEIKKVLFDKEGELLRYLDIYVNLESAYPEDLAKPVKDGDEIDIIPMIGGG